MGVAAACVLGAAGCGGDEPLGLFQPKPECQGDPVVPLHGQHALVLSKLGIGGVGDGFDFNHDGFPDNKLAALGPLAGSRIQDAFDRFDLVVPLEMFDFPTAAVDSCVKLSFYIGSFKRDEDHDGYVTGVPGGDCDDHDPNVHPGAPEIPGNGKDDNCNGLADETVDGLGNVVPSTDTLDRDHDGVTIKDGDCDDTNPAVKGPGTPEMCGDGYDNDCDGVADHAATGAAAICSPYDDVTPDLLGIDARSYDGNGKPKIIFNSAETVMEGGVLRLKAGPSFFSASVPFTSTVNLDLELSGATISADVVALPGGGIALKNGRLGGVLDAYTLDHIRGIAIKELGVTADQSLLDAIFANVLGTLLALPRDPASNCLTPDIDVDGDGLEAFCDSNPSDSKFQVDTCIDGDGTVVYDQSDANGTTIHCTEARKPDGSLRFVDGISVELNFEAVPALLPAK